MAPLLQIRGLRKEFRIRRAGRDVSVKAVDGVDLEVFPGDTLGLVGESGSGKTTLARCALRLLEPTAGSILFNGVDLLSLNPSALRRKRREFQIIFQDAAASLDPRMTLRETLLEPFEVQGVATLPERESRVRELLEAVSLDPVLLDRLPGSLSGGQQQRVAIARALALKPRLLIADEPVSALDASVQAQILNLLLKLQNRFGLTLILISHSLTVIHYLSTTVAVMYLGRIVEEGPTGQFFTHPRHPYSQLLLQSMPVLDPAARREKPPSIGGEIPTPAAPPAGCHFHPRCPRVMSECRKTYPDLVSWGQDTRVACFLYTSDSGGS